MVSQEQLRGADTGYASLDELLMAEVIYSCMTKATTTEGDDIRRSANWLVSRRARLKVISDSLMCGDWTIAYDEIDEAVLFRTSQMFIPCYVLRVRANGAIYQFGLNPGRFWKGELPFPVRRESMKVAYSPFSIVVRLVFFAGLAYWLWSHL